MLDANPEMYRTLLEHNIFKFPALFHCSGDNFKKLKLYSPQNWEGLINLFANLPGLSSSVCELDDFV